MEESFLRKKNIEKEEDQRKKGLLFILGKRIKKGRLLFLLFAVLLTLIGLSASTYAWFTSNFTVSVQEIDVNVSSGSGIQISTDATKWKSLITIDDITSQAYAAAVNQVPQGTAVEINPVSTVKTAYANATTASQGLHMYRGTIVNDVSDGTMYLDSVSETDGENSDYVAFDLFIKMDFKTARKVYLTGGTGVTAGNPNTNIEYAGRMGFVVQGNMPSSTSVASLQAIKGATNVLFYEPNYDVHTGNGLANGTNNYPDLAEGRSLSGNATPAPYYGVKAEFAYDSEHDTGGTVLNSHDTEKFDAVTVDIKTASGNTEKTEFLTLQPGVTKIRVYMWIEGQDIDCENTASGGQVKFNLGFTVDENETVTPDQPVEP